MNPIYLETPRLYLREMRLPDAADMVRLNEDPEVVRFTGDGAFESIAEAEALIRGYRQYADYGMGRLFVFTRAQDEFLGFCGLKYHADEDGLVDLGYRLMRSSWGHGYAFEASQACLADGFGRLGLQRIVARIMPENVRSEALAARLGFVLREDLPLSEDGMRVWDTDPARWRASLDRVLRFTGSGHPDFLGLMRSLDVELATRNGDLNAFYKQFNAPDLLQDAGVVYAGGLPAAIGAFKVLEPGTVEIKRMYVHPAYRRMGLAQQVLTALEGHAAAAGIHTCVLETGTMLPEAIALYEQAGYTRIPNYGQYEGVETSVCYRKVLS